MGTIISIGKDIATCAVNEKSYQTVGFDFFIENMSFPVQLLS